MSLAMTLKAENEAILGSHHSMDALILRRLDGGNRIAKIRFHDVFSFFVSLSLTCFLSFFFQLH